MTWQTIRWALVAVAVLLAAQVDAQATSRSASLDSLVQVAPNTIDIDPTTHHATLRLSNPSDSAVVATPVVTYYRLTAEQRHTSSANGLYRDSLAKDSVGHPLGLRAWITDPSPHVSIVPHGTATITYELTVPERLAPGDYVAYVYCRTSRAVQLAHGYTELDDFGGDFTGPATLIYHVKR